MARLESSPAALESLQAMESSDGEPDVIDHDKVAGQYVFCDCSAESPVGRRSLCYDQDNSAQSYYAARGFRGLLRV